MVINFRTREDGKVECTGFPDTVGIGDTADEAFADFKRLLAEHMKHFRKMFGENFCIR